jgi:hypothetical protein
MLIMNGVAFGLCCADLCLRTCCPAAGAAAKADAAELAERVDSVWAARLEGPDPLLAGCQREEVRTGGGAGSTVFPGMPNTATGSRCAPDMDMAP